MSQLNEGFSDAGGMYDVELGADAMPSVDPDTYTGFEDFQLPGHNPDRHTDGRYFDLS